MRLVQSVAVTPKFVEVKYDEHKDDAVNEFSVKMKDRPRPDLVEALGALAPYVIEVIEQPATFADGMTVRKVSWKWTWDKEQGQHVPKVTVHATKVLANNNSPWNVHSPLCDPSDEFGEALALVHDEALEYVDGKREPGTLPLEEEGGE